MISRFRIEAEGRDKQQVYDSLVASVAVTIRAIRADEEIKQPPGEWECTDDAITGNGTRYNARMVLRFRPRGQ
jgi:hypothetical protein